MARRRRTMDEWGDQDLDRQAQLELMNGGTTDYSAPPAAADDGSGAPGSTPPGGVTPAGRIEPEGGLSIDPWFNDNPFPDGGTREQQEAWQEEAKKHGPQATEHLDSTGGSSTPSGQTGGASSYSYQGPWLGWDSSRSGPEGSGAGSLKYDAQKVLGRYNPADYAKDRNLWKRVQLELEALHPGQYEMDEQGNIMLTGTADGYIGARPEDRNNSWEDYSQPWAWQWMRYNEAHKGPSGEHDENAPVNAMPTTVAGAVGGTGSGDGGSAGDGGTATTGSTRDDSLYDSILARMMGQDLSQIDMNDPILKAQSDTYRAQAERARREMQSGMAELYGSQGMSGSGALAGDVAGSFESMGQDIAGHDAELMSNELQARRDEVARALALYSNDMNAEEQRALQLQIANIDAAIERMKNSTTRYGMDLNNDQFNKNLGFNISKSEADLNNEAIRILLGI